MVEYIAETIKKITGTLPKTEQQGIKLLEGFLEKKHLNNLGLGLRDLIEISVYYTDHNPSVILNKNFDQAFSEKEQVLENNKPQRVTRIHAKRVNLNASKNKEDKKLLVEYQKKLEDKFFEIDPLHVLKTKVSLVFMFGAKKLGKWTQLAYFEEEHNKVKGKYDFANFPEGQKIAQDLGIRVYKTQTDQSVDYEMIELIIQKIIDHEK